MDSMNQERELRRYQSILSASGMAVIAFGIWSIVKTTLLVLTRASELNLQQMIQDAGAPKWAIMLLLVILVPLVNIDVFLRIYVGLSARKEAAGKKKRIVYLVIAWIVLILGILSIIAFFGSSFTEDPGDAIVTLIIEATSVFAMINLIRSAGRVRELRKTLNQ